MSVTDSARFHPHAFQDGGVDVVMVEASLASALMAALPPHWRRGEPPLIVVLADVADEALAADLVRTGAVGWVYRSESIVVVAETVRAVLRGEARLPQPLFGRILDEAQHVTALTREPLDALLTRREIEILRLLEQGIDRSDVAAYLHLSPNTVRSHVQNILNRLGVHSTLAAVAKIRSASAPRSDPFARTGTNIGPGEQAS